ncbi:hypothetical protein H2198_003330 [Neophaeococcomyces mojaviensis]|uniref:Uncharacterized protein n=1 Tax=Neophaeococcomyces mojaviensis TaxID=3383035 RepID=A0ACC3ABR8_9EURO|nr:hypothetical protein H2198_003330 [Knufia sp. JES_112]
MHIIIVGAGIAGLSAAVSLAQSGHVVTILESASALAEVGAGVQLTPNTTKWLWKWGCASDVLATSALPESFNVSDGVTGTELGSVSFDDFTARYGGPYLVIHRGDIHRILHEHAIDAGVAIRLNSRVKQYFPEEGRLILTNGDLFEADLIIAVDGINSGARQYFMKQDKSGSITDDGLENTGWAAFRLMADVASLGRHAGLKHLATSHRCNCAAGDGCSIMTYKVKGADKLNLVLSHPDNVDTTEWTQEHYRDAIHTMFRDFSSDMRDLLNIAMNNPDCTITNWPVQQVATLPAWASDSGKLVLMGDAAHAMCFYLSMGVSMAAEDAAALTECLNLMQGSSGKVTLADAMKLFECVRKPRAKMIRDASLNAGRVLHLPVGQERNIRDASLQNNGGQSTYTKDIAINEIVELAMSSRYGIVDNTIRDWCYRYDVVDDIRKQWQRTF